MNYILSPQIERNEKKTKNANCELWERLGVINKHKKKNDKICIRQLF